VFAITLFLMGSASASVARADDAEESRFHDELGRQHYQAHRFEQALREFFDAARLAPSPAITFNIAVCFDLLRRADDAYLFFREYVASDDADAERRRFASEAIARLEGQVARLAVTSDPPGALIYVDQREHGAYGITPRVLALPPGSHVITLERAGYRSVSVTVEARQGAEVAAAGTLSQIVGALHVAGGEGAAVEVREAGGPVVAQGTALLDASLPPGLYQIDVRAAGFRPFTSMSRVTPEARTDVQVALEALPPATGDLTITSSAAGAMIQLDGERAGFAPTLLQGLLLGEHRVRLEHPGLEPYEGTVTIDENARGWLTVTLEEPSVTQRSPLTWAVGGVGVASLVAGAVVGGLAVANHSQFIDAREQVATGGTPDRSPSDLRTTGESLNLTTDVLLGVGVVAVATAVILYFTTEYTDVRQSRAAFSAGER
jgi:hypothetical protein